MDIISHLTDKLCCYSKINAEKVIAEIVPCNSISQMKLRDHLIEIGTILEHDEKSETFVATISSGLSDKNLAIVSLMLRNEMLYAVAYAKEGLIYQATAKKALQKVFSLLR